MSNFSLTRQQLFAVVQPKMYGALRMPAKGMEIHIYKSMSQTVKAKKKKQANKETE